MGTSNRHDKESFMSQLSSSTFVSWQRHCIIVSEIFTWSPYNFLWLVLRAASFMCYLIIISTDASHLTSPFISFIFDFILKTVSLSFLIYSSLLPHFSLYTAFQNGWDSYSLYFLIKQSSYNNQLGTYRKRLQHFLVSIQCTHHELCCKSKSCTEIPRKCAASTWAFALVWLM